MTGLTNGGAGILPHGDNTSVKAARGIRAGHSYGRKDGGFVPPHGDNTPPPKGLASSSYSIKMKHNLQNNKCSFK